MLTIIVVYDDGGITDDELNQFSFTGRVEGELKTLISLHNAIVSDENVHTVHGRFTINGNNTVIGGCKINSFCMNGKIHCTATHTEFNELNCGFSAPLMEVRHLYNIRAMLYYIVLLMPAANKNTYHQLILLPASAQGSGTL